jgi:hypothetical protein
MKKKILKATGIIFAIGIVIAAIVVKGRIYANYTCELKAAIKGMSDAEVAQLLKLTKEQGHEWYAGSYKGTIEHGIIALKNGEIVKFAFISHHTSKDSNSHSYFEGNKYKRYVRGWFCCEVEFGSEKQPKDSSELDAILSKYDGIRP